jgi:hypothetical protein
MKHNSLIIEQAINRAYTHDVRECVHRSWLSMGSDPGWHHESVWTFNDGTEVNVRGHGRGAALPAEPGFEVLFVDYQQNEDDPTIARQPVIGWQVAPSDFAGTELEPVVQHVTSTAEPSQFRGVVQPDGRVLCRRTWLPNEEAFLKATKAEWLETKQELEHERQLRERHSDCPYCAEHRRKLHDDDIPF